MRPATPPCRRSASPRRPSARSASTSPATTPTARVRRPGLRRAHAPDERLRPPLPGPQGPRPRLPRQDAARVLREAALQPAVVPRQSFRCRPGEEGGGRGEGGQERKEKVEVLAELNRPRFETVTEVVRGTWRRMEGSGCRWIRCLGLRLRLCRGGGGGGGVLGIVSLGICSVLYAFEAFCYQYVCREYYGNAIHITYNPT